MITVTDRDIQPGTEVRKRFENIREEDVKLMTAITRDPNPIHFDRQVVDKMGLPGLINQGASNLSYLVQVVEEISGTGGDITDIDVRFRNQVYEGDSLTATATVDTVDETEDGLIANVTGSVIKSDDTVVVTGSATVEISDA